VIDVPRGFTLIETIVATALLAIALVTLAQIVATSVRRGLAARTRTTAVMLAEQRMEELRGRPWASIVTGHTVEYLDTNGDPVCEGAVAPCNGSVYVRTWSATPAPFNTGVALIEVSVEPVGVPHGRATLVTARSRKAP